MGRNVTILYQISTQSASVAKLLQEQTYWQCSETSSWPGYVYVYISKGEQRWGTVELSIFHVQTRSCDTLTDHECIAPTYICQRLPPEPQYEYMLAPLTTQVELMSRVPLYLLMHASNLETTR